MLQFNVFRVICCAGICGSVLWGGIPASHAELLTSDGDFDAQTIGQNIGLPWNGRSTSGVTATASAQSPFTNLFADNGKGSHWPAAYSPNTRYIVGKFTPAIAADATGLLYFNADFRNTSEEDDEAAGYTLVVTSNSQWNTRTVALYVGRDAVYAESSSGVGDSLLNPVLDTWYNVQLTLSLNDNTYSGLITQEGGVTTAIASRSFVTENVIDCIFTDYGTHGAFAYQSTTTAVPTHDIDNFALSNSPVPEPGSLALLGAALFCLAGFIRQKQQ